MSKRHPKEINDQDHPGGGRGNPGGQSPILKDPRSMGMKGIHSKVGMHTESKRIQIQAGNKPFLEQSDLVAQDSNRFTRGNINRAALNQSKDSISIMNKTGADNMSFIDFSVHPTKPGNMVYDGAKYKQTLNLQDYPETALDSNDYQKRLRFEELKKTKLEEMCNWKQKDERGLKKNSYIKEIQKRNEKILTVTNKNKLEKLEVYTDRFPLLELRKAINKAMILVHMVAFEVSESSLFNNSTITVILINSFIMMADSPAEEPTQFNVMAENIFLILYTLEMVIKILGYGFIMGEDAYIRSGWNVLDFVIVVSSLLPLLSTPPVKTFDDPLNPDDEGFNISGLRAFRVLRPLKTISSVKGLKVLMQALGMAMPLLKDTIIILVFFFLIMAIAGCNLLSGLLKNRCMNIQTGRMFPDELPLCSSDDTCPGGYYCGKSNQNPNFGVTNFDNVCYAFLCVFQSVTLEGWSEIQADMQVAYTYNIWLYFIPLVFIGAFFLLNLTLAVINSEFTKATKEQKAKDEEEKHTKNAADDSDDEMDRALTDKDKWSIMQFITAKIYAKKMIEFLRMRQKIKLVEQERINKMKNKQAAVAHAKRQIESSGTDKKMNTQSPPANRKVFLADGQQKVQTIGNGIIPEEEYNQDEASDQETLDQQIQEFLKQSRLHMHRQSYLGKPMQKSELFGKKSGQLPTMKGNIGPTQKTQIENSHYSDKQRKLFSKMAEEFDIDQVIPKNQQKMKASHEDIAYSEGSFNLSIKNEDIESLAHSQDHNTVFAKGMKQGILEIPGVTQALAEDSGLITSDSDFELNQDLGQVNSDDEPQTASPGKTEQNGKFRSIKKGVDIKKDVTRTFKKMLTKNHNRGGGNGSTKNVDYTNESTKYGGSQKNGQGNGSDADTISNNEIEMKYIRKRQKKSIANKLFKEEDEEQNSFIREDQDNQPPILNSKKNKKDDMKQLQEFITTKRPRDPFKDLDPLTQKVDISKGLAYHGASQNEIFQKRIQLNHQKRVLAENKFLMLPNNMQETVDPDFVEDGMIRSHFEPYQQKIWYQIYPDSSDGADSDDMMNEDVLFAQEQPYITPTSINYKQLLKQLPTEELAKRSDIMITSTLSQSNFMKDKRTIINQKRALMTREQLVEYIDEKAKFNALAKETIYETGHTKDKEKDYKDHYVKSFIHRSEFETKALVQFKKRVKMLNSNQKVEKVLDPQEIKDENLRFQQNKNASEKRGGVKKFDMEMAKRLLDGKFYDMDEGEDEGPMTIPMNQGNQNSVFAQQREGLSQNVQLENFQAAVKKIFADDEYERQKKLDEIPFDIRHKLDLPQKLGIYEVNFNEVKKQDVAKKHFLTMWSGQDVLPNQLNNLKSEWITNQLNGNRVWPLGFQGFIKRIRFLLRIMVKADFFNNSMTFAVLCNTITLSIDHYGIEPEVTDILDWYNDYFTWIFIFEMVAKLLALGFGKYADDRMNWLDGFVVILSVVEIVAEAILAGEGEETGMAAFKTVRMLRTFRVFRIARLLRALESMQTIIAVMIKSYKSFIYITLLMFLFIIIFSLLGMQIFGGKMNFDDGLPRGNFDVFWIAFITIFQILTMENWQTVLFDSMRSSVDPFAISIFYISWIFLGNFILLNLFLAILLDSFLDDDDGEEEDEELIEERRKHKMLRRIEKKRKIEQTKLLMGDNRQKNSKKKEDEPSKMFFGQKKADSEEDLEDLDEDQIIQIFKDQNLYKKDLNDKGEDEEHKMYEDVQCQSSLYLFDQDNCIRTNLYKLCRHWKYWETIVQLLIAGSSLKLAVDTYFLKLDDTDPIIQNSMTVDFFFNYAFIIEMSIKIISFGLIMDEGSYLRDTWNQLDFFIVMSSIFDMLLQDLDVPVVKIMRMLRVLRPLKMIKSNPDLKMIVLALLDSFTHIANVLIVIFVVFLIFAILAVNFWGGKFFYCSIDMYRLQTEQQCLLELGQWMRFDHNFDNVKEALNALYVVSSLEGWPDVMFQALDTTGIKKGPTKENNIDNMLFFVVFILIGSFFFLNFFIGVLFLKFNQAQERERAGYSDTDLGWIDIQKLIMASEPEYESTNVPKAFWRRPFHDLVSSTNFEITIMTTIVLNMFQMAAIHETQTEGFQWFLDFTNYIFTFIFLVEAILKLIAFGTTYFNNAWNRFDFFVVVASVFDIALGFLEEILGDSGFLSVGPQLARVMRVLRVTRILRLAGKAEGLQAILQTITFSLPSLMNVISLLMLIFFMFSILGNFLFNRVTQGDVISELKNFTVFDNAFLLLFAISTGEDWNKIMFDCSRTKADGCIEGISCGYSPYSYWYFYIMILMCSHVMLNLFILVIIQQFEKYYLPKENNITLFKNDLAAFLYVWKQYTQDRYHCMMIKENQLTKFFRKLGDVGDKDTSLGFGEWCDDGELKKEILKMGIKSDQGYVYFNEILYRCMQNKYWKKKKDKNNKPVKLSKKMQIIELKTQYDIFNLTLKAQNKTRKLTNEDIYNNIIKKENGVNPFLTVMNFRVTFKTWAKQARKKIVELRKQRVAQYGEEEIYDNFTGQEGESKKTYTVDIDIEYFDEYTSDEEVVENELVSKGTGIVRGSKSNMSINSSQKNKSQRSMRNKHSSKKKDHLALFEKKMTSKFKKLGQMQQTIIKESSDVTLMKSSRMANTGLNFAASTNKIQVSNQNLI